MQYGFSKAVSMGFEQAVGRVTEELAKEGFGVLTSIDVRETLKKKLNVDFPRYTILGACNPPFALQALTAEEQLGLLLPCNAIVYEKAGIITVGFFDPMVMTTIVENPKMKPIAEEIERRLRRVMAAV